MSISEALNGFKRLAAGIEAAANGKPLPARRWHHCLPVLDFAAQLHEKRRDFVGRQWLFDEIDAWRASSSRERALLVVGDPGIGKSAFVAEMIHRNPDGHVLAYHICRADDPETLRPSTFVMSLAGMIAGRLPAFADLLESPQFQELFDPKAVSSRPAHVFDQGLIAALHQLPTPTDGIRFVLIDALDEALTLGEGRLNIVSLLSTRLDRLPAWLRLVATTRREPDVLNRLSSLRAASIDAHRQDNLDDIDRFIVARLQTPNLAERLSASRVPVITVQRKLRDKADGNFLYVSQALQDIERDNYSFSRLDELPQGLNQWYETWFARKFPNPKVDFMDARKVLEVLVAALEPPTLELLAEASEIETDYRFPEVLQSISPFCDQQLFATNEGVRVFKVANGPDQYTPTNDVRSVAINRLVWAHKSIADWLVSTKSPYRISVLSGHRRLIGYCNAKLGALRSEFIDPMRGRTGDLGPPQSHMSFPYALKVDLHYAAVDDWKSFIALFEDEWFVQRRYPPAYNYFPLNYVPDDWTVQLPESASKMPPIFQLELCFKMSRVFCTLCENLIREHRLEQFPDGGKYAESLRRSNSEQFVAFRDGCYTFVYYVFQVVAYLELAVTIDRLATIQKCLEIKSSIHRLGMILDSLAYSNSTGLSGRLEDQADSMFARCTRFENLIQGGTSGGPTSEEESGL